MESFFEITFYPDALSHQIKNLPLLLGKIQHNCFLRSDCSAQKYGLIRSSTVDSLGAVVE
jgi:hypothetical protein